MHTVIFPYFSEPEIIRYERILAHIERLGPQMVPYEFLLASSPAIRPSERLYEAASRVAPTRILACNTEIFGYPAGCTAMFWDCMSHVANDTEGVDDFVMWFESDMCPVKSDWLDRLSADWKACGNVYVMGYVIPDVYRQRRHKLSFWRPPKVVRMVNFHVNGGGCYRRDLINLVGVENRAGVFDVEIGKMLEKNGGYADCPGIALTTTERLPAEKVNDKTVVVHGFLQDKDEFLSSCFADLLPYPNRGASYVAPVARQEKGASHPSTVLLDAVLKLKDASPRTLEVVGLLSHEGVQYPCPEKPFDRQQSQQNRDGRRAA